jgi:hypothetical protein
MSKLKSKNKMVLSFFKTFYLLFTLKNVILRKAKLFALIVINN